MGLRPGSSTSGWKQPEAISGGSRPSVGDSEVECSPAEAQRGLQGSISGLCGERLQKRWAARLVRCGLREQT